MLEKPKISTAIAIREFLKKFGRGYPWQIWHFLHIETKTSQMSYASFISYFKTLERLGLVLRVDPPRVQPPTPPYRKAGHLKSQPRVWFTLNQRKVDSEEWRHPQRSLHPRTFRLTHRPKGRPPGSRNKPKKAA
jgi:hypothetical protein